MNRNLGKFFKKLFNRKKEVKSETVQVKPKARKVNPFKRGPRSTKWIGKHNALQAEKAKKRRKNRKKTRVQKANRIANRKGGRS